MLGKESNRLQELKEECKKKRDEIKAKLPADGHFIFHQSDSQLLLKWKCSGYKGQGFF